MFASRQEKRFMAQLHFYTLARLEADPNWKPDHMKAQ